MVSVTRPKVCCDNIGALKQARNRRRRIKAGASQVDILLVLHCSFNGRAALGLDTAMTMTATEKIFPEGWKNEKELELTKSFQLTQGVECVLEGDVGMARHLAFSANYLEQWIYVELRSTKRCRTLLNSVVLINTHSVSFFGKCIPCTHAWMQSIKKWGRRWKRWKFAAIHMAVCQICRGWTQHHTLCCMRRRRVFYCSRKCATLLAARAEFDSKQNVNVTLIRSTSNAVKIIIIIMQLLLLLQW